MISTVLLNRLGLTKSLGVPLFFQYPRLFRNRTMPEKSNSAAVPEYYCISSNDGQQRTISKLKIFELTTKLALFENCRESGRGEYRTDRNAPNRVRSKPVVLNFNNETFRIRFSTFSLNNATFRVLKKF